MKKIAIIGGGVAAMSAAVYALRANADVTMFAPYGLGGLVATIDKIDNFPSETSTDGWTLSQSFVAQIKALGLKPLRERVLALTKNDDEFHIVTDKAEYEFDSVVVASGTAHNKLGFEAKWVGRGVSYCATCDGNFYRGKTVAVVGGGDTAVQDALLLANTCRSVTLIHRRNAFRASPHLVSCAERQENIRILRNYTVQKLLRLGDVLQGVELLNLETEETERLDMDGLFIAVGQAPQSAPFQEAVAVENGYYLAGEDTKTSLPGVFAAGDGRKKQVRQLTTAVSDGAAAALAACRYLEEQGQSE